MVRAGYVTLSASGPNNHAPRQGCGRIRFIEIEDTDLAPVAELPPEGSESEDTLRGLLRLAALLRGRDDQQSIARRRSVWADILELETYFVTQKVRFAGVHQHGRRTVDEQDVSEVVAEVMRRLVRLTESFEGTEVGQFRKAIGKAVDWSVADYAAAQAKKRANEVAVDPGAFDPGSLDPEERPGFNLAGVIDAGSASERIELLEELATLGEVLAEREREVVVLRAIGHSSKEVADELELSPANVDQIYHRSLKRIRAAVDDGGTNA